MNTGNAQSVVSNWKMPLEEGGKMGKAYDLSGTWSGYFKTFSESDRCPLCNGYHSSPLPAYLECPRCKKVNKYMVHPQCPAGVCHAERHTCPSCGESFFVVVYWDGQLLIPRTFTEVQTKLTSGGE